MKAVTTAATISTTKTVSIDDVTMTVTWTDGAVSPTELTSTYFNDLHLTDGSGNCKAWVYNGSTYTLETYTPTSGVKYKKVVATLDWPDEVTDAQKAALVGDHVFHIEADGANKTRVRLNDTENTYANEAIEFTVNVDTKANSYALTGNSVTFYVTLVGGAGSAGADEAAQASADSSISASLKVVDGAV